MTRHAVLAVWALLAITALVAIAAPVRADELTPEQREAVLQEAQAAFERGAQRPAAEREAAVADFRAAAERYEQLLADGLVNAKLLYNLGGAYLLSGDLGRAIVSYRHALDLAPRDARLQANLAYARSLRMDQLRPSAQRALLDRMVAFHRSYPQAWRQRAFAFTWAALWVVLIVQAFRPTLLGRVMAVTLALASSAVGGTIAYDALRPPAEEGVVVSDEVVVRKGNGEGYEPMYAEPLHEGTEFVIRDRRPGWLEIELVDGAHGWVPERAVAEI